MIDRMSCVLWMRDRGANSQRELTTIIDLRLRYGGCQSQTFDKRRRFVLDITIFSPIIYIWYEGGRLRQRIVKF
jgi:hypothetical protein